MDGAGLIAGGFIAVFALGAVAFFSASMEQQRWDAFARKHDCKKVGEFSSSFGTGVGVGMNGSIAIVPVSIPGKTGYACNDGVTYWR